VRFFLDHNIPVSVRTMLLDEHHECWTAAEAGLAAEEKDDNLSVYADAKQAALITFDREFSRRRIKNPIGRHIWLRCQPPRAALVLRAHLGEVLDLLHRDHVAISVSDTHVRAWSHPSD
jgi:predicted nuclease of predicted toxin-antitoxin system